MRDDDRQCETMYSGGQKYLFARFEHRMLEDAAWPSAALPREKSLPIVASWLLHSHLAGIAPRRAKLSASQVLLTIRAWPRLSPPIADVIPGYYELLTSDALSSGLQCFVSNRVIRFPHCGTPRAHARVAASCLMA